MKSNKWKEVSYLVYLDKLGRELIPTCLKSFKQVVVL
jgi:hypothetical protein